MAWCLMAGVQHWFKDWSVDRGLQGCRALGAWRLLLLNRLSTRQAVSRSWGLMTTSVRLGSGVLSDGWTGPATLLHAAAC